MANTGAKRTIDASSIIDMEVMDGDESDYESSISGNIPQDEDGYSRTRAREPQHPMEDMQKKVTQNVASYVWQSGSQQAKNVLNTYANIDLLRPYFNVEPHEVRLRLLQSLMPQKPGSQQQKVPRELYGPTMLIFTMVALLLFQMKTGGHTVQEGTLMGTAVGTCFGYWLGVSGFVWFLAYVCNAHITMLQILCLLGYALFGHCLVLGITTVFHTSHDHMFFYIMWAIFGGLSTLRLVSVIMSRTAGQTQRLIVCGSVAVLHLCFLLYLHFAYHKLVEDLSDMMDHAGAPQPGAHLQEGHRIAERSINGSHLPERLPNKPPLVASLPKVAGGPQSPGSNLLRPAPTPAPAVHIASDRGQQAFRNLAPNVVKNMAAPTRGTGNEPGAVFKPLVPVEGGSNHTVHHRAGNQHKGIIVEALQNQQKV